MVERQPLSFVTILPVTALQSFPKANWPSPPPKMASYFPLLCSKETVWRQRHGQHLVGPESGVNLKQAIEALHH
jgi:hypothetical protein